MPQSRSRLASVERRRLALSAAKPSAPAPNPRHMLGFSAQPTRATQQMGGATKPSARQSRRRLALSAAKPSAPAPNPRHMLGLSAQPTRATQQMGGATKPSARQSRRRLALSTAKPSAPAPTLAACWACRPSLRRLRASACHPELVVPLCGLSSYSDNGTGKDSHSMGLKALA